MSEIYTRLIKTVIGDGGTGLQIFPTPGKRVHNLQLQVIRAGGVNTLAALMTDLTAIRAVVGTTTKWEVTGTQLRDWMLLHGTQYDFNGLPNTGCQITIPFSPEWYFASVADSLAWNPAILGGTIKVEIDSDVPITCVATENISDDLEAVSAGIITLEVMEPIAAGTGFIVEKDIDIKGRLLELSIYPDDGNNREPTPVSMYIGSDDRFAHERQSSAQNDEALERKGFTPSAAGRSANIYDIVFCKDDALSRGIDLVRWGQAKIKIEAALAMAGISRILMVRLEPK